MDESTCPSNTVIGFVNTRRLKARLLPTPTRFSEPVRAETLYVSGRTPLKQRFNEQFANAARARNAVRVAAAGHDEALYATAFADDKPAVRRKRRPPFADKPLLRPLRARKELRETFLEAIENLPVGFDRRGRSPER